MTPERWSKIEELFLTASDLNGEARLAYLSESCAGDDEIGRAHV